MDQKGQLDDFNVILGDEFFLWHQRKPCWWAMGGQIGMSKWAGAGGTDPHWWCMTLTVILNIYK